MASVAFKYNTQPTATTFAFPSEFVLGVFCLAAVLPEHDVAHPGGPGIQAVDDDVPGLHPAEGLDVSDEQSLNSK